MASVPEVCVRPQRVAASPPATGTLPVVSHKHGCLTTDSTCPCLKAVTLRRSIRPLRPRPPPSSRCPSRASGARGESLENYIRRLEALEEIATAKSGVAKAYALQAGREIRVIVEPTEVDDDGAVLLSHEIAREIEDQLEYPGQVKVIVIRESRAIEVAK